MSRPQNKTPLRGVTIDPELIFSALERLAKETGVEEVVDLRADAYGFGLELVSQLAHELGFRSGQFSPGASSENIEQSEAISNNTWAQWAHEHSAQIFQALVVGQKAVPEGAAVSYGGLYVTTRATNLALVSAGFADGVPRLNPPGGEVQIGTTRYPVAGRISMDQLIVDTGDDVVTPGSTATIWGDLVSISEWSAWSRRPVLQIGSSLGSRVQRLSSPLTGTRT